MAVIMDPLRMKPINHSAVWQNLAASAVFRAWLALSVLAAVIIGPVTYWAMDTQVPYDFLGDESFIIPQEATGNDQMLVKWKVRRHRTCPGLVWRELVDPRTNVVLAAYDPQAAAADTQLVDGFLNKTFTLPLKIQSGWIAYRSRLEYWCNPLQRVWPLRYNTPVLYFKVLDER